ncbi:DUF4129 domain-containing protein [uncultured Roseibium sp.]|uniref:DUF4129 domain-containing protein n=1 Tax=uncultured Roseibium sp. TaxID=1936171 RepID=UPI00262F6379|nr:DUF4129 domain-containing protein [uncultured Roseibium sp.]
MRCLFLIACIFSFAASVFQTSAQEAVQEPVEIGEAGTEYLRSIRLRGIDSDVAYFDPTAPAPELDTQQQPAPQTRETEVSTGQVGSARWISAIIAGLVLAGIVFVVLRFGGNIAVSLNRDAENPGSQRGSNTQNTPAWAEKLGSFNDILRIEDRRRALVLLTQKVLASLASTHGVLMQRSWTARDTLGHIPLEQTQHTVLRTLVLNSERVQFGGRDVTEDEFRNHVSSCQQLLGAGGA